MRDMSLADNLLLLQPNNFTPYLVVAIQWIEGGIYFYYGSREIGEGSAQVLPSVLSIDEISSDTQLDGAGSAAQVSVLFTDRDTHFKGIIDKIDIHRRSLIVYQCFAELSFEDRFIIFDGEIASPIVWDEGQRTLSVSAITRLSDQEIGFAPESGMFPQIHQSLLGKPWPLCFGKPFYVPCQPLQEVPTGTITIPFGVPDPTLGQQLGEYSSAAFQLRQQGISLIVDAAIAHYQGDVAGSDALLQLSVQLQDQATQIESSTGNLAQTLAAQQKWVNDKNIVIGGDRFPQKKKLLLKIDEALFYGTFRGEHVTLEPIVLGLDNSGGQLQTYSIEKDIIPKYAKQGFVFINAGAQVTIIGDYPITWIANCLPSSNVTVYAYQSYNGLRKIAKVPASYYKVQNMTFGSLRTTAIVLKKPLTSITYFDNERTKLAEDYVAEFGESPLVPRGAHLIQNTTWEEQIYVVLDSEIGPNPVDIMRYLITTYTNKQIDDNSFIFVHNLLGAYPMNFAYFDRPNVYQAVQDLAYQARCAIWLSENRFHIRYLPFEYPPERVLNLESIVEKTLQITSTPTEDIVTKYVATWRPDYLHTEASEITIRHNIARYGLNEETHDFYALTDFQVAHKVATFWMIRKSTTWKKIQCQLTVELLPLETYDTVVVNFHDRQDIVSNSLVNAMVESISYNPKEMTLNAVFWLPIRFGSMDQYIFAWPSDISESFLFPTYYDITSGNAGGFSLGVGGSLPAYNGASAAIANGDNVDDPSIAQEFIHPFDITNGGPPQFSNPPGSTSNGIGNKKGPQIVTYDLGGGANVAQGVTPIDWGAPKVSDRGDSAPTRVVNPREIEPIQPPTFDYDYPIIPGVSPPSTGTGGIPGVVVSGTGASYRVRIYPKGLSAESSVVDVTQMQITNTAQIPAGTATFVFKSGNQYLMQVPVWLRYIGPD